MSQEYCTSVMKKNVEMLRRFMTAFDSIAIHKFMKKPPFK